MNELCNRASDAVRSFWNRICGFAIAAVMLTISLVNRASAQTDPDFTVGDVITSSGLTTKITSGATQLATVLGTLLVIWIAFKLFYKGRRAAGASLG